MAMRTFRVDDEGDAFELAMFDGDVQIAGAIIPMSFGVDEAYDLAKTLGKAWTNPAGDGEVSSPYRPDKGTH